MNQAQRIRTGNVASRAGAKDPRAPG